MPGRGHRADFEGIVSNRKPVDNLQPCLSDQVHWWIIDGADGPTSLGICRHCRQTRRFENSVIPETVTAWYNSRRAIDFREDDKDYYDQETLQENGETLPDPASPVGQVSPG